MIYQDCGQSVRGSRRGAAAEFHLQKNLMPDAYGPPATAPVPGGPWVVRFITHTEAAQPAQPANRNNLNALAKSSSRPMSAMWLERGARSRGLYGRASPVSTSKVSASWPYLLLRWSKVGALRYSRYFL